MFNNPEALVRITVKNFRFKITLAIMVKSGKIKV